MKNSLQTLNNNTFEVQQNLYFTLSDNKYAIPLKNVVEVMKLPALGYPQKLPNNIIGVLKFNNININILDIRFYLDVNVTKYSVDNKLIVVKTDESIFGIIADNIENIIDFENSKIERLPFVSENRIIDSLYHIEEQTVSILNMYALEQLLRQGVETKSDVDIKSLFPTDEKSLEVFNMRAKYLITKLDNSVAQTAFVNDKFVTFALNETSYCINLKYVKEVTNKMNIIQLPCSPDYIEGLMTVRGDFITVINFKKILNLSHTNYSQKPKVIIIDSEQYKIGFLVDEIFEIADIPEELIYNKKTSIDDTFISSEIIRGNDIQLLINMEKVLSDEKMFIDED